MDTTDDFDEAREWATYIASDPRIAEWQSLMESLQQPASGAKPGEWWADMELVFTLE
jgi:L-rhamnose mutarotase